MSGATYHYFRQLFVNLFHKVQEVMNLEEEQKSYTQLTKNTQ